MPSGHFKLAKALILTDFFGSLSHPTLNLLSLNIPFLFLVGSHRGHKKPMSFATSEAQQQIGDYIQTAAAALYIFECVITFSQEVDVIWRRKWTMATWLYACTRYTALLYSILTMISRFEFMPS
ncbi:hypothetical protein BDY19DRAFT_351161 [Irpex rosettiformis]|uniref:Uncharacterized protein n=1 Tax=Irpex rosettiformis TaxID=378272 RepID=A0ACB8TX75_9APHY|nr:hypothetical protein BDY19DRAFT_351161 [Irpex rosettiformis]